MTLNELTIRHVQKNQPWTIPYSPGLVAAHTSQLVPHVLASHAVLHVAKTVGKLAAIFEKLDHSGKNANADVDDVIGIGEMSADLITIALRFANLYGIDIAKVLVERVEEKNAINLLEIKETK